MAGPDEYVGGKLDRIQKRRAPLRSLAANQMIEEFVTDVRDRLPAMIKEFLALLPR